MSGQAETGWKRREFLGAAALLAAVVGVPAATVKLSALDEDEAPSDRQRALLREVSQLVLPRTSTPGAGEVGTGDFVALALAHGLEGSRKRTGSCGLRPAAVRPVWTGGRVVKGSRL